MWGFSNVDVITIFATSLINTVATLEFVPLIRRVDKQVVEGAVWFRGCRNIVFFVYPLYTLCSTISIEYDHHAFTFASEGLGFLSLSFVWLFLATWSWLYSWPTPDNHKFLMRHVLSLLQLGYLPLLWQLSSF